MLNFFISDAGVVSQKFREMGISSFQEACQYIKQLPYRRNTDKENLLTVLTDGYGTCSTRHALLKLLAMEQRQDISLMLCIFSMNKWNTPEVTATLEKYDLDCIPEAHNYLVVGNEIIDCTRHNLDNRWFVNDILTETAIDPNQITGFKVSYHRQFLNSWLQQHPQISYSADQLYAIREQCILDLTGPVQERKFF